MKNILDSIDNEFELLNQSVASSLYTDVDLVDSIGQYIIDAGGKRIRPILVILCSKALHNINGDAIKLATIIEYIHTATLLHDDVVDISTMRRGRPTVNAKWGNAPAVLVGDFIYSRSFELLVEIGDMRIMQLMATITNNIAAGEVLQLAKAGNADLDKTTYFDIINRKTAILFEAACRGAAILANQPAHVEEKLAAYGRNIGLAFQLIDDYLDYAGDANEIGKNLGDDFAEGKTTLPLILSMEQTTKENAKIVAEAISNKDIEQIDIVTKIVKSTTALQDTQHLAEQKAQDAKDAILEIDIDTSTRSLLIELADLAVQRNK